jgi:2-haloacid dehalogenase
MPIKACVFDAYGTLFDFASPARDLLGDRAAALTTLWRDKQLQYCWLRSLQGLHADFWHVTRDALDYALDALHIDDAALADRLMALYLCLDAFPDVAVTLQALRQAGLATAILSNGTPTMLDAIVGHAGLRDSFDALISIEEVGIFKTAPQVYQRALDRLGLAREEVCFVSSNGWDAHAAAAFGMRVVWCNRYDQCRERLPGTPDFIISTLSELVAKVSDFRTKG